MVEDGFVEDVCMLLCVYCRTYLGIFSPWPPFSELEGARGSGRGWVPRMSVGGMGELESVDGCG